MFAALLLSAVNTALADLVSIQFMLSRNKELPHALRRPEPVRHAAAAAGRRRRSSRRSVVLIFPDVEKLAGLYAIGVVGAISINLGTTSTNRALALQEVASGRSCSA